MNWRLLLRLWKRALFVRPHPYDRPPLLLFPFMLWAGFRAALLEIVDRICLRLDDWFFPGWRNVEITRPLFIIGVPRSGTTLALRLVHAMDERFSSFLLWEQLFAPSIVQKRFFLALGRLDARLGAPLFKLVSMLERRARRGMDGFHPSGLFQPEEDEVLFYRRCDSPFLLFRYPFREILGEHARFDQEVPAPRRRRLMELYRDLVKRHMYVFGGADVGFAAKAPTFTQKIRSLREFFPDARFLIMIRDPRDCIPSNLGFLAHLWELSHVDPKASHLLEDTLWVLDHLYAYPAEALADAPPGSHRSLLYADLVQDPANAVEKALSVLGLDPPAEALAQLRQAAAVEGEYRSSNRKKRADCPLSREEIEERYASVLAAWDFPSRGDASPHDPS